MSTETSNIAFSKIHDTIYDSNLLDGLAELGVFPSSFKVHVCTVDLAGLAVGAAVIQTLVDDKTGEQIVFIPGQQVVALRAGAQTAIATEANLDLFAVGLAATSTGAVAEVLATDATGGETLNGAGITLAADTNGGVVSSTNVYGVISTTVTSADLTAGVARVVLVVV
jgi:hypothetical protein